MMFINFIKIPCLSSRAKLISGYDSLFRIRQAQGKYIKILNWKMFGGTAGKLNNLTLKSYFHKLIGQITADRPSKRWS